MIAPSPDTFTAFAAAQPEVLAQVADLLAWPLLLVSGAGTLVYCNRAAQELMRLGQPLRLGPRRQVEASSVEENQRLAVALGHVAAGRDPGLLRLAGAHGGYTLALSRLETSPAPEPVLLLALTPAANLEADVEAFAALHQLTPAETRVLQRLALGESSARAAAALGVSATTVRSQTMSLRRKTGHANVAELMRALATMPPLARSGPAA